jgi:hypothetical protein
LDPEQIVYDRYSPAPAENDHRQPREAPVALPPDDTQNTKLPTHELSSPYLLPLDPEQIVYDRYSPAPAKNDHRQPRDASVAPQPNNTQNPALLPVHEISDPHLQPSDPEQTGYVPSVTTVTENDEDVLLWIDRELGKDVREKYFDCNAGN